MTSEGVSINSEGLAPHEDCEREMSRPRDCKNSKMKVKFKDLSKSMPRFTNLHETGLRKCKLLKKEKPAHDSDNIV